MRGARLAILGAACLLLAGPPSASGHDPLGRAEPSVETIVKGSGLSRVVVFRVRDVDSGNPIPAATLSLNARDDDGTVVPGSVIRVGPELFRCTLELPRPGRWHVGVRIGGDAVVPTAYSVDVDATGRSRADPSSGGAGDVVWVSVAATATVAAAIVCFLVVRRRARR